MKNVSHSRKLFVTISAILATFCAYISLAVAAEQVEDLKPDDVIRIVSEYNNVWKAPPKNIPGKLSINGPLLGNGDMKVAIGGVSEALRFYIGKNDLWYLRNRDALRTPVFGTLTLEAPALKGAGYSISQTVRDGVTTARFATKPGVLQSKSYVAATRNLLLIELSAEKQVFDLSAVLIPSRLNVAKIHTEKRGNIFFASKEFTKEVADIPSGYAVAWKVLGSDSFEGNSAGDRVALKIKPETPVTLVIAMDSLFKSEDYKMRVVKSLSEISEVSDLLKIRREHTAWWDNYWRKGYIEIDEPLVQRDYYRSLYILAASSRDPGFPPGLFAWNTTDNPAWGGAYWMNYNFVASFYGLVSSNRLEQHDPQDAPFLEFIERGRELAKAITKTRGVLYPISIGPKGIDKYQGGKHAAKYSGNNREGGTITHGQRSNAAYGAVNMVWRWYGTYDLEYAGKVYPYVREVATFWEDYLKFENSRYVIYGDSIHEGSGRNANPILTLGLVHNTMAAALDMSRELGIDTDRREKWQHIIDHLSGYVTQTVGGRTVFRYTEKGMAWNRSNTLGIQQVFPGNTIALDSHPELLQVAQNTARVMQRWYDGNGSNSFFPTAVRIGLDPQLILNKLAGYSKKMRPNGFWNNPHGIENCSTVPNTLSEMLCMSYLSVGKAYLHGKPETRRKQLEGLPHLIRLFYVWPKNRDARFVNIRTRGAFLVSSELKDGKVRYVSVLSEKGRTCHIQNPWPGAEVSLYRDGARAETVIGERIAIETKPNETIRLVCRS